MTADIIDQLLEITESPELIQIVATKGNYKRIYNNVSTWTNVQKIIDSKRSEGWEVRIIN